LIIEFTETVDEAVHPSINAKLDFARKQFYSFYHRGCFVYFLILLAVTDLSYSIQHLNLNDYNLSHFSVQIATSLFPNPTLTIAIHSSFKYFAEFTFSLGRVDFHWHYSLIVIRIAMVISLKLNLVV